MNTLEKIAAEVFRHVSNQVNGTSLGMKVNPYTISLTEKVDITSDKAIAPDVSIKKDVETMWFYEKKELA
jgi:hypothetical protein